MEGREIKIKVLYEIMWCVAEEISIYPDGSFGVNKFQNEKWNPDNSKIKAIIQFTGLKDKNGKEIYESDIVKLYYKGEYRFCEIVFVEGIYCLKWDDGYINKYPLNPPSLEVVGNIYENNSFIRRA